MNSDPNIFECLLDPLEIFTFYQKIGIILKNDRDIASERMRGQALQNTLILLEQTSIIQQCSEGYIKLIDCQTFDSFYVKLIAEIKNKYADEVATIINCNKHFDESKSQFFIYVNDIPLKYMGLAMLLEQTGEFERIKNREYLHEISSYKDLLKKKPLISLEDLQKKLRQDTENGERAELFALEYEAIRLKRNGINMEPLRVSNIDVMAGYDMVSYENDLSDGFDRFIEVKSFSSTGFFWSKNEYETAKLKGNSYYLYLVDLRKISDPEYEPEIIQNPVKNIMESSNWFIEAQSYHIRQIQ